MICSVKARTFKYNTDRSIDFAKGLFIALRAACERLIAEFLLTVKLDTAAFASVGINWHISPHPCTNVLINKVAL